MKLHFIRDETKTVNDVMYITSVLEKGIRFTSVLENRWRIALRAVIMLTQCKGYQPTVLQTAFLIHCAHHDDNGSQEYVEAPEIKTYCQMSCRKKEKLPNVTNRAIRSGIEINHWNKQKRLCSIPTLRIVST